MSVRSSMIWIINLLRLKLNDEGVTTLDPDQYYTGDSIKLTCEYADLWGSPVEPISPSVNIWDPNGILVVDGAMPNEPGVIGLRHYVYQIPEIGPEGVWRVEFTGRIDNNVCRYPMEFEVVTSKRIWTDEELQNLLDLHRIHIRREMLSKSADGKTYYSKYTMLEDDITIWDLITSSARMITPTSSNLVDGTFTFDINQNRNYYLDGKSYNIHNTMAECMEQLAMDSGRARIWERGGVKYTQYDYFEMAKYHRSLAGVRSTKLIKTYN